MENPLNKVPIHLKMTLTAKEAAEYSNIGINKIDSMLRSPNCPFVLFVGARTGYNNFRYVKEVMTSLPEIRLVVVGGERDDSDLDSCGFDVVRFPSLPNEDLNCLYNNAVCLLYPSLYEGFGIPVLEAMKAGCPVIAFNNSSIPEVSSGSCILLENNDRERGIAEIKRLLSDSAYRETIANQETIKAKAFSWDRCYAEVKLFYMSLLFG